MEGIGVKQGAVNALVMGTHAAMLSQCSDPPLRALLENFGSTWRTAAQWPRLWRGFLACQNPRPSNTQVERSKHRLPWDSLNEDI
jgi:hypothetical protein